MYPAVSVYSPVFIFPQTLNLCFRPKLCHCCNVGIHSQGPRPYTNCYHTRCILCAAELCQGPCSQACNTPQSLQDIELLLGIHASGAGVEVLHNVNTKKLITLDSLHRGDVDVKQRVITACSLEVNYFFSLFNFVLIVPTSQAHPVDVKLMYVA